ncbi:hypothetical protein [Paenibacillus marinisediminis]
MHSITDKISIYHEMDRLIKKLSNEIQQSTEWNDAAFLLFEDEWETCKQIIESSSSSIESLDEDQEKVLLQQLIDNHQSLLKLVESKFNDVKSQVVVVKQNQTIANAYYNLGRMNDTAYYFDKKQ